MAELWPEGNYVGDIVKCDGTETKKGDDMVLLTWLIQGANKITRHAFTAGKGTEISTSTLKFLGWNGAVGEDAKFTNGKSVELYMKHNSFTNDKNEPQKSEEWKVSNPDFVAKPLPKDRQTRLGAKFRAQAGIVSKPTVAAKPSTPPPSSAPPPAQTTQTWTKDTAWAEWEALQGAGKVKTAEWHKAIAAQGNDESKFTAADWQKIAEAGSIPF